MLNFPIQLISPKLAIQSVLRNGFERLILMMKSVKDLVVSFTNTEHEVYCFDEYLFGENWYLINNYVDNLQFNITVHRTRETFLISSLISKFDWFQRKIISQTIHHTNGCHLFSLLFLDLMCTLHTVNHQQIKINGNDFVCVHHLHLTISNEDVQFSFNASSNFIYRN